MKAARVTALLEFYKPQKFPPAVLNMQKPEWLAKVETAYCVKEKQVDTELGNMREQLTQEMRKFMDSKGNQSTVKLLF